MASLVPNFGVVETILASAVADDGTFTVSYPTGFSQKSFARGLNLGTAVMFVNGNDRWTEADPGFSLSYDASLITVTNLTGASLAAGSRIKLQFNVKAGNDIEIVSLPINLASITTAGDVVTEFQPGFAGTIESVSFLVNAPVTTASKAATLNLEIGTTNLTGGVVSLTSAAATPMGKVITGTDVTGGNTFTAADVVSVEASSVTAFSEGSGTLLVRLRKSPNNSY